VGGWLLLFELLRRRRRLPLAGLALLLGTSAVLAAAAVLIDSRVSDRATLVVTESVTTRSLPSLEARPLARLNTGEVVRLQETRDDWARVSLDGRSAGWVHNSGLLRIAID
jgi:uncharacterized protein YgiM (DUF1202 family)